MRSLYQSSLLLLCLLHAISAVAENPVSWMLDEEIRRTDNEVFWTSPTAIDLGFDQYNYDYEITRILATVLGGSVDVTDEVGGAFDLVGSGTVETLPALLIDAPLNDSNTGTMADVRIEVDGNGFGQAAFTNVALGRVSFGLFQVDIQAISVEATISLTGIDFAPGDYNRDGTVDPSDYNLWAADYGSTQSLAADGNEDGTVDAADYTVWRDNASPAATAIPEPATLLLVAVALMTAGGPRRF